MDVQSLRQFTFELLSPDFTTAARMAIRINETLGGKYATAVDASRIDVLAPYDYDGSSVELVAILEGIDVEADRRAKVILNERTGTVVIGSRVTVAPVAVAHGNLRLEIAAKADETQAAGQREKSVSQISKGSSIAEIAGGLNEMGATPDDLLAILQSLKASGALLAEVEMR
jgi:flagellar P-ring protein precursor FlgI